MRLAMNLCFRRSNSPLVLAFTLVFLGLISSTLAYTPSIVQNTFDLQPKTLLYFEDSPNLLYLDEDGKKLRRSDDDGKSWKEVDLKNTDIIHQLVHNPADKKIAYALTSGKTHYVTEDQGSNWREINLPLKSVTYGSILAFHASNPNYVLYSGIECSTTHLNNPKCIPQYFYTENNFKDEPKKLISSYECSFAKRYKEFTSKDDDKLVFCLVNSDSDPKTSKLSNRQLVSSSDWFQNKKFVQLDGQDIHGVVGFGGASKFLVALTKHDTDRFVSLLVSTDGTTWDEAEVLDSEKGDVFEYTLTVLESSTHSLHVDLANEDSNLAGDFYISNSNGTYFTKSLGHTHRNPRGLVDIESVENIDGILIANVVTNYEKAKSGQAPKRIRTKVSYDDGRTWSYLATNDGKCKGDEECGLNLHSVLDKSNIGRIFSSPAIGVIAGVGNTGKYLKDYEDGDLYISHDSALSWFHSRSDAHKYEFGDSGNIITAIRDEGTSSTMIYSIDRGVTWNEYDLGMNIRPKFLFTTQDSTSTNFILMGRPSDEKEKFAVFSLDFSNLFSRKCDFSTDNKADFEKWYARWEDKNNPSCIMGHKQFIYRRKPNADCFVGDVYNEQKPQNEPCLCVREDYECDYNFIRQADGTCKPSDVFSEDKGSCSSDSSATYTGKSGYALIPGNDCIKDKGLVLDEPVEKKCDGTLVNPVDDKPSKPGNDKEKSGDGSKQIKNVVTNFDGKIVDYVYLKSDDSSTDETILLKTDQNKVYYTHDHGATWEQAHKDKEIVSIYVNTYHPDRAYLITTKEEIIITKDHARTWQLFRSPSARNSMGIPYLTFSKAHPDWLIWAGEIGCERSFSPTCHSALYYSTNNGGRWNLLQENVKRCNFVNDLQGSVSDKLIYCERLYAVGNHIKNKLLSSTNFFESYETLFDDIIEYALEHEFVVVATTDENGKSLKAHISVDGKNFAEVRFPSNFQIDKQQAYTILESITHSIFLHVTTNSRSGSEYGTILKSNSNGTDYISSLDYVNRNQEGYVDFEKMIGLEGVAIVNVVNNYEEAFQGSKKKLKSLITYSDGSEWSPINPPRKDSEGKDFNCPSSFLEDCSLNLHGYTERQDYRDTFSSQSAVGMMLAVGNVGEHLTPLHDGDTFFTKDGGLSWKEVKKGYYMWEFGDQGSIIVIVNGRDNTNVVHYTLDEGDTWNDYKFSEEMMRIEDITTVLSDSSQKFLLIGRPPLSRGEASVTIQLDFTNMFDRKCVLNEEDPQNDDFDLWTPRHPFQEDNCLFGHETQYYRKVKGRDCYVGRSLLEPHKFVRNCSCTRQDYECDFNYVRGVDGACQLVPGYSPPDHSLVCTEMPGTVEYWIPTGYRRIPLSTCQGGREFDKVEAMPCPGKEKEFEDKHRGLHGFGLFMVIVLPIGMTAVIGYIIWDHVSKRYGQIRLGEEDDEQNIFVRYFVVSVAAMIAVVSILPELARSGVRYLQSKFKRSNRFTSRRSFARGRTDYSVVAADEDELLGDDSSDIGLDDDEPVDSHA